MSIQLARERLLSARSLLLAVEGEARKSAAMQKHEKILETKILYLNRLVFLSIPLQLQYTPVYPIFSSEIVFSTGAVSNGALRAAQGVSRFPAGRSRHFAVSTG